MAQTRDTGQNNYTNTDGEFLAQARRLRLNPMNQPTLALRRATSGETLDPREAGRAAADREMHAGARMREVGAGERTSLIDVVLDDCLGRSLEVVEQARATRALQCLQRVVGLAHGRTRDCATGGPPSYRSPSRDRRGPQDAQVSRGAGRCRSRPGDLSRRRAVSLGSRRWDELSRFRASAIEEARENVACKLAAAQSASSPGLESGELADDCAERVELLGDMCSSV